MTPPGIPLRVLTRWAAGKPTIKALHVFGSYARGEARPDSDLDLAIDFMDQDDALPELIVNAAAWKAELCQLTGIVVKDIYLITDTIVRGPKVMIFTR